MNFTTATKQMQKTIQDVIEISGIGLFTGEKTSLRLLPAPAKTGIVFRRMDLEAKPLIAATLDNVSETPRCTILSCAEVKVRTVEHLLSALYAFGIDNLFVEITGAEVPAGDGSSSIFINALQKTQLVEQETDCDVYTLNQMVSFTENDIHMVALPSQHLRISYTLHYPTSNYLRSQYVSFVVTPETFYNQIASSRTFSLYEEIEPLLQKGLIKGGGLDNAVIIKEDKIMNPEGVRFKDEMARHKVLDLIGDLSLLGRRFSADILAVRSGHSSNISFAKLLRKYLTKR